MWEVSIKTMAYCVIEWNAEIFMGMTKGLQGIDVTAHQLIKAMHCTVFSPSPVTLLLLSAVHGIGSWHEALAPWDYFALLLFLLSSS